MIKQYGALPYRIDKKGGLRFLLVTSRDTGRWVVPKGNPMLLREGHEAAAQEAFEEAGVRGQIGTEAIGTFRYRKRRRLLPSMNAEVKLFPLRVDRVFQKWPEAHERERQWFTRKEAAAAVAESGLKRLILGFEP